MELIINPGGVVLLDEASGTIDWDRGAATGAMRAGRIFRAFRLYGPFGQGYHFDVFSGTTPKFTLTYSWRDGTTIYPADERIATPTLWVEGHRLLGDQSCGSFTHHRDRIRVELTVVPPPFEIVSCAVLVALDVMYANRTMLFAR